MPLTQDEVMTKLSSVNAALDLILFADKVYNEAVLSKFKMSIGATRAIPPDETDNLWCDEAMSFEVDLNDDESLLEELEDVLNTADVAGVSSRSRGVEPEYLSKIWGIDVETAKRTIDITTQHCKHDHNDHLS